MQETHTFFEFLFLSSIKAGFIPEHHRSMIMDKEQGLRKFLTDVKEDNCCEQVKYLKNIDIAFCYDH